MRGHVAIASSMQEYANDGLFRRTGLDILVLLLSLRLYMTAAAKVWDQ